MKALNYCLLLAILSLFSCKQEDDLLPTEDIDFYALTVGNTWIYDNYSIDIDGTTTQLTRKDTMSITAETIINGETYFLFEGTQFGTPQSYYRRDSSGFLVDETGTIFFSSTAFNQELKRDTLNIGNVVGLVNSFSISNTQIDITTDAGTFNCYNFKGEIMALDPDYPHGTRESDHFYSPTIGLIWEELPYYSSPRSVQLRLVEYQIE